MNNQSYTTTENQDLYDPYNPYDSERTKVLFNRVFSEQPITTKMLGTYATVTFATESPSKLPPVKETLEVVFYPSCWGGSGIAGIAGIAGDLFANTEEEKETL
jgi:hypothetical protein